MISHVWVVVCPPGIILRFVPTTIIVSAAVDPVARMVASGNGGGDPDRFFSFLLFSLMIG